MNEIYVIGHHNPDTDSIVSAMAYAALRNALGDRNYVAAHMDHISDQTQRMLDRFGFQPPRTVQNVRTQVEDLDYDTPPALNATVTMDRAWHIMREQKISAIPVINEDGTRIFRVKNGKNEFVDYDVTGNKTARFETSIGRIIFNRNIPQDLGFVKRYNDDGTRSEHFFDYEITET